MAATPALEGRFDAAQAVYRPKIEAYARQQARLRIIPSYDQGDIECEMLEVLWLACNTYDPNHGATFNTYFWTLAQRRLLDLHKAASRQKRAGDYERVWLESEAVRDAVSEIAQSPSAEEEVLARMRVREVWNSGRRVR